MVLVWLFLRRTTGIKYLSSNQELKQTRELKKGAVEMGGRTKFFIHENSGLTIT